MLDGETGLALAVVTPTKMSPLAGSEAGWSGRLAKADSHGETTINRVPEGQASSPFAVMVPFA